MTFAGWTCGSCGRWVPNNQTHECQPAFTVGTVLEAVPLLTKEEKRRLFRSLDRIVELLEMISGVRR